MRVGLLADVHGNSVALRACLGELDAMRLDRVYFLGDAVGYLPDAVECLRLLEETGALCQQGNHEAMLLSREVDARRDAVYRLDAARERLGNEILQRIAGWPHVRTPMLDARRAMLVHGSPQDPLNGYVYADSGPERLVDPAFDVIVMGHTHRPFALNAGERLLLNVGSVGLPRDVGNLASFAVYDSQRASAAIYRVGFDVAEVLARWGREIHEETAACLNRHAERFEGERIA